MLYFIMKRLTHTVKWTVIKTLYDRLVLLRTDLLHALTSNFHQSDKHSYVPMLYQNVFLIGHTTTVY